MQIKPQCNKTLLAYCEMNIRELPLTVGTLKLHEPYPVLNIGHEKSAGASGTAFDHAEK